MNIYKTINILTYFWKFLHYNLFVFELYSSKLFHAPFKKILQYPPVVRFYSKRGINNPSDLVIKTNSNPKNGNNSILAGIHMGGLLVILQFSISYFILGFLDKDIYIFFHERIYIFGLLFLIIAGIINYFLLFKGDQYLDDFSEFKKLPCAIHFKYRMLSLLFVVSVPAVFFTSVLWATNS